MGEANVWNSLEITKLMVSTLTPIAVAFIGIWLNRRLKRLEHYQWANQKVIEKRLEIYSQLAPLFNDLYCYFDFIGEWKWKAPMDIIALKRSIDRLFYVNAPLFSKKFSNIYEGFINQYFVPGPLKEYNATAKLRADIDIRIKLFHDANKPWDTQWETFFADKSDVTNRKDIQQGYHLFMYAFSSELGIGVNRNLIEN